MKKHYLIQILLLVIIATFNGCALLQIPGQLISGTFGLLGKLVHLAGSLPKPPPGVFF